MRPLLSVLTPSYNYAQHLPDALSSVRGLGPGIEHVVIDDESTDGSRELLRALRGEIVYVEQLNRGLAATLNTALTFANGEWIGWLNADDFYLPWTLEAVRAAASDGRAQVVYGDTAFVDAAGRLERVSAQYRFRRSLLRHYGTFITPPAFFVRRDVLPKQPWDEQTIKLMDLDLYLGLEARGAKFRYVPFPLGAYRRHSLQESRKPTPVSETLSVRRRHGLPEGRIAAWLFRRYGGVAHRVMKALEGGYARQAAAAQFSGAPPTWWCDEDACAAAWRFGRQSGVRLPIRPLPEVFSHIQVKGTTESDD
jgi:glycosyltransferase involved in cell wall biosynthesis